MGHFGGLPEVLVFTSCAIGHEKWFSEGALRLNARSGSKSATVAVLLLVPSVSSETRLSVIFNTH